MTTRRLLALTLLAGALACTKDLVCPAGEVDCGGRCTSLQIDPANCGTCGVRVGAYQECDAGAAACAPATTTCGTACSALAEDPANCGACGNACAPGEVCSPAGGGTCAAACPTGLAACSGACADLQTDPWHCGTCGTACLAGESCHGGVCAPDVYVACFATDDVRPANAALRAGLPRAAGKGPISLAVGATAFYAANSLSHSLSIFDLGGISAGREVALAGSDFEHVTLHDGLLFVSNSGMGTLIVYDPARGKVVDEVALGNQTAVNPHGVAFVGEKAYVALYGLDATSGGQEIAVVDFSTLSTCTAPPCGSVVDRISVVAAADAGGLPFPNEVVNVSGRVFVTLSNLTQGSSGYYNVPAGDGKLAVIDTANADALSFVDLGAGCENPGGLALDGTTLWIACGATAALVPVDVSGDVPAVGAAVATDALPGGAPGSVAFCRGMGYVTDEWSGTVLRFDPSGAAAPVAAAICPTSQAGWAWAADVACAP